MRGNGSQQVVATALGKRPASTDRDAAVGFLKRTKTNEDIVDIVGGDEGQGAQAGRAGIRADEGKAGEEEKAGKESRPVDEWKPLEQELFTYAITMFGLEDSCACARLLVRLERRVVRRAAAVSSTASRRSERGTCYAWV
jgi:hypothetical protein